MEKWEYLKYHVSVENSCAWTLEASEKLLNEEIWDFFNRLGDAGWEMISVTSLEYITFASKGTNGILFVFKRRKQES